MVDSNKIRAMITKRQLQILCRNNNYSLLIMYILGDLLKVFIHYVSLFGPTQVMAARTKYVKEWKKRKRMVCIIFNLHKKMVISE